MNNSLDINIDRLRGDRIELINTRLSPDIMNINEQDLKFVEDILVKGEAYVASQELILKWTLEASALLSCSVCNQQVLTPIFVQSTTHAIPLSEISHRVFHAINLIREDILLETPSFTKCGENTCLKENELKRYMKDTDDSYQEKYHPFEKL